MRGRVTRQVKPRGVSRPLRALLKFSRRYPGLLVCRPRPRYRKSCRIPPGHPHLRISRVYLPLRKRDRPRQRQPTTKGGGHILRTPRHFAVRSGRDLRYLLCPTWGGNFGSLGLDLNGGGKALGSVPFVQPVSLRKVRSPPRVLTLRRGLSHLGHPPRKEDIPVSRPLRGFSRWKIQTPLPMGLFAFDYRQAGSHNPARPSELPR